MTDESKNIEETRTTESDLVDVFVDFAVAKEISVKCQDCGSEEGWSIYTNKNSHQVIPGGGNRDIHIGPYGIDVVTMKCRNCGAIRMFDLDHVKSVSKAERAKNKDSGSSEGSDDS